MNPPKIIKNAKLIITPKLIFEDEYLFVIEKPSGWITNDASTTNGQPTVQTWVRTNHKSQITDHLEFRDGIVHRLDKETSGILLVAKTKEAFEALQMQFKTRIVSKTYTALAHGRVLRDGLINEPVGRLPWRRDRFGVLPGGRDAITCYRVITNHQSPITKELFSLLELAPKTGRTHQLRIHLKHIGHPIVSDEFYAGRKTARNDRLWCPRLFLHAGGISFIHPEGKKKVYFSLRLPEDLNNALESLVKID